MLHYDKTHKNPLQHPRIGQSGNTYPYQSDKDGHEQVVKTIRAKNFEIFRKSLSSVVLAHKLNHDGILPIKGFDVDYKEKNSRYKIFVILPRAETDLQGLIDGQKSSGSFPKEVLLKHIIALLSGLDYLHQQGIVHRKIKPSNILYHKQSLKLADIHATRIIDDSLMSSPVYDMMGEKEYIAPEAWDSTKPLLNRDLFSMDLWSLGVIILELCLLMQANIRSEAPKQEIEDQISKYLKEVGKKYGLALEGVIAMLLSVDPQKRKTASEVKAEVEKIVGHSGKLAERKGSVKIPEEVKKVSTIKEDIFMSETEKNFEARISEHKLDIVHVLRADKTVDDRIMDNLGKTFSRCTTQEFNDWIQMLHIDLSSCYCITDNGLSALNGILKKPFGGLESLSINLSCCYELSDQGIRELLAEVGAGPNTFKHFSFSLRECRGITDDSIKGLLDHSFCRKMTSWQSLSLDLGWCYDLTSQAVVWLTYFLLSQNGDLYELSLDLSGCLALNDDLLRQFLSVIGVKLQSLRQLQLKFRSCQRLTDEGVKHLETSFGNSLGCLTHLLLDFSGCERVTDTGLESVARYIGASHPNLESLSLLFHGCYKVTNVGLELIASEMCMKLKTPKHLEFCFSQCHGIDLTGLLALVKGIEVIKGGVETLLLNFSNLWPRESRYKSVKQSFQQLLEQLKTSIKVPEGLVLNLEWCPLNKEAKTEFKDVLPSATLKSREFEKSKHKPKSD